MDFLDVLGVYGNLANVVDSVWIANSLIGFMMAIIASSLIFYVVRKIRNLSSD